MVERDVLNQSLRHKRDNAMLLLFEFIFQH
jgi:hypothetical protein